MNVDLNLLGWGGDVIVWGGVLTEQARSELVDRRVAVLCRKDLRYEQFEGVGVVKLDVGVPMEFSRPAPNRRHLCSFVKGPAQVIRKDKIVSIVSRAELNLCLGVSAVPEQRLTLFPKRLGRGRGRTLGCGVSRRLTQIPLYWHHLSRFTSQSVTNFTTSVRIITGGGSFA